MVTLFERWWFSGRTAAPYESEAAFSHLYEGTHRSLYRYVYGLLGGTTQDAEDITAQAYLKAWDNRRQFSGTTEQAKGWLFTIAKRIVIDRYRQQQIRPQSVHIDEEFIVSSGGSPEEKAITAEQIQTLWKLLQDLSTEDREMIVLRYMVGWSVKDIAAHMDMNPNTISVRLRRVLEQLKGTWKQHEVQKG